MSEPLIHFTDVGDCKRQQWVQLLELAHSISQDIRAFENTRTGHILVNLRCEAGTRARVYDKPDGAGRGAKAIIGPRSGIPALKP